jgi:hypothetical protein
MEAMTEMHNLDTSLSASPLHAASDAATLMNNVDLAFAAAGNTVAGTKRPAATMSVGKPAVQAGVGYRANTLPTKPGIPIKKARVLKP